MFSLAYQPCDMACPTLAIGEDSHCDVCNKITCREHYDDPAHTCGYTLVSLSSRCSSPADVVRGFSLVLDGCVFQLLQSSEYADHRQASGDLGGSG